MISIQLVIGWDQEANVGHTAHQFSIWRGEWDRALRTKGDNV